MSTSPFDDDFLLSVRRIPGVGAAEGRTRLMGWKIQTQAAAAAGISTGDGAPLNLELRANPDYQKSQLDR
jgi:hypothetical protein